MSEWKELNNHFTVISNLLNLFRKIRASNKSNHYLFSQPSQSLFHLGRNRLCVCQSMLDPFTLPGLHTFLAGVRVPSISNKHIILGWLLYFQSSLIPVMCDVFQLAFLQKTCNSSNLDIQATQSKASWCLRHDWNLYNLILKSAVCPGYEVYRRNSDIYTVRQFRFCWRFINNGELNGTFKSRIICFCLFN